MLSTQLIIPNYLVILSHQRSTTVSLETYPLKLVLDIDWSNRKKAANEINMVIMSICQTRKVSDAFLSEDFQNSTTINAMEKKTTEYFIHEHIQFALKWLHGYQKLFALRKTINLSL